MNDISLTTLQALHAVQDKCYADCKRFPTYKVHFFEIISLNTYLLILNSST